MSDEFDNELDQIMADTTAKAEPLPSGTPAAAALIQFIERVERLEEEKAGLMEDIRSVYGEAKGAGFDPKICLLYTSPSPRDATLSRMPSSA